MTKRYFLFEVVMCHVKLYNIMYNFNKREVQSISESLTQMCYSK